MTRTFTVTIENCPNVPIEGVLGLANAVNQGGRLTIKEVNEPRGV